jgi:hypothetical protein
VYTPLWRIPVHSCFITGYLVAYLTQFLPGKLTVYGRVLKSVARVVLVRKAADEIRIVTFLNYLE